MNIKSQAFPVAISARHIHVSEKDLQALFGPNATLTKDFDLSQPGQFAAKERVSIEGPKGVIHNVRVLATCKGSNASGNQSNRCDETRFKPSPKTIGRYRKFS
ncbi:Phosphate propanoyltransferase OS=Lysinibacillus sphaericus OX=1421 GN=pduL_2 PE=3 SV=1 [Lysinibacillus sphaericus]